MAELADKLEIRDNADFMKMEIVAKVEEAIKEISQSNKFIESIIKGGKLLPYAVPAIMANMNFKRR